MPNPADDWLKADAQSREFTDSDCQHDPTCRSGLAHYEREFGIMFDGGPAESRARYHETLAGLMGQDDLAAASIREKSYTPERNRKRRRGWNPDGAPSALPPNDCD